MGSVAWTIASGLLPAGLAIDAATGSVSGTPTAWGTTTALVQASDTWQPGRIAQQALTITVSPAPLTVATASLGSGVYQQYFQTLLKASGGSGSVQWTLTAGALPTGVMMDASGSISGTPSTVGAFNVTVQATDTNWPSNQASAALALTIAPPPFAATMPVPPNGQVGVPYQMSGSATGQLGTVVWSVVSGALPGGLSLNASTGVIAGVPSAAGSFSAVIQAADSWDTTRTASMTVAIAIAPATLSVATSTVPAATLNRSYRATLSANGGSGLTTWTVAAGALPAGLTLGSDGTISGTPSTVCTSTFSVRATDAGWPSNTATAALTMMVSSGEVVLYATDAARIAGAWSLVADTTAAGGKRIANPDLGAAKLTTALASPANYFEITFQAQAGVAYHLWLRGKADKNNWANDSVFVQFSDSVDAAGAAVTRVGTTSAETVSIENGVNAGLSGWGWNDNAYSDLGTPIYFATSGTHTVRVQVREDGLSIDQIVLSPQKYLTTAPGAAKNDTTILAK